MVGAPAASRVALRYDPFILLRVITNLACLAILAWALGPRVVGGAASTSLAISLGLVMTARHLVMGCAVRSGSKQRA